MSVCLSVTFVAERLVGLLRRFRAVIFVIPLARKITTSSSRWAVRASRGYAELVQYRLDGGLKMSLEAQRDVILRLLCDVVATSLVGEATLSVVVTSRDVAVNGDVN